MIPPVTPGAGGGWQHERRPRLADRPLARRKAAAPEDELVLWQLALEAEAPPDARPVRLRVAMYMESQLPEWAFDQPGSRIDFQA
ncbi:MAG: hypothetical protein ACLGIN_03400 [Candidatus Sericytochromatia bacterium]